MTGCFSGTLQAIDLAGGAGASGELPPADQPEQGRQVGLGLDEQPPGPAHVGGTERQILLGEINGRREKIRHQFTTPGRFGRRRWE